MDPTLCPACKVPSPNVILEDRMKNGYEIMRCANRAGWNNSSSRGSGYGGLYSGSMFSLEQRKYFRGQGD